MKKLIGGGLAALAIGLTACSATGGAGSAPTSSPTYATYATPTVAPTPVRGYAAGNRCAGTEWLTGVHRARRPPHNSGL
jgi:hypothetical protein